MFLIIGRIFSMSRKLIWSINQLNINCLIFLVSKNYSHNISLSNNLTVIIVPYVKLDFSSILIISD